MDTEVLAFHQSHHSGDAPDSGFRALLDKACTSVAGDRNEREERVAERENNSVG